MKTAIVSGANGFVGSNLCRELTNEGVTVTAIVFNEAENVGNISELKNLNIVYCNLDCSKNLINLIDKNTIDVFYHLAWNGAGGVKRTDYTIQLQNVKNALDCYSVADELGCKKFVSVGTIGEYMTEFAMKEKIISDNFIYAVSKSFAHTLLDVLSNKGKCAFTWCTLSGIFGIGDRTVNLVNYTLKNLLKGSVPEYSSAEQYFDFLYIEDCVHALYMVGAEKNTERSVYIGSGNQLKLKDYLLKIRDCVDKNADIGIGKRPDDGTIYKKEWFNTEYLIKKIGFKPRYTFEEGIKKTINWLKSEGI